MYLLRDPQWYQRLKESFSKGVDEVCGGTRGFFHETGTVISLLTSPISPNYRVAAYSNLPESVRSGPVMDLVPVEIFPKRRQGKSLREFLTERNLKSHRRK